MLAIRLQRRGRKGHAQFRVIVQEARLSPKSEKVVANLGAFDPHTKETTLDKEKAEFYLEHGAQPSNRVVKLFVDQKVKLPKWVELDTSGEAKTKNPDKLRKNQPAEAPADETTTETPSEDAEATAEAPAEGEKQEKAAESTEEAKTEAEADTPKTVDSEEKTEKDA